MLASVATCRDGTGPDRAFELGTSRCPADVPCLVITGITDGAVGGVDSLVQPLVVDASTMRVVGRLGQRFRARGPASLALDSQTVLYTGDKGDATYVTQVDVRTGGTVRTRAWMPILPDGAHLFPFTVALSPDGRFLYAPAFNNANAIGRMDWERSTVDRIRRADPSSRGINVLRGHGSFPAGSIVAWTDTPYFGRLEGALLLLDGDLDLLDSIPIPGVPGYGSAIHHVAASDDESRAYVLHTGRIALVDLIERRIVREVPISEGGGLALRLDPGARHVLLMEGPGYPLKPGILTHWSGELEPLHQIPLGRPDATQVPMLIRDAAISADGKTAYVLTGSDELDDWRTPVAAIQVVDLERGTVTYQLPLYEHRLVEPRIFLVYPK
jgi:hypothetical protein